MDTLQNYSVNETASRARLAARGVGYSWGLADEVSRSVFWLSQRNISAMALLTQLLSQVKNQQGVKEATPDLISDDDISNSHWLCPIITGCAITDWYQVIGDQQSLSIKNIKVPCLLMPFIAQLANRCNQILVLECGNETIATDGERMLCSNEKLLSLDHADRLIVRVANANEFEFSATLVDSLATRVPIDDYHWKALSKFAHNTYAPATESSRLSGAGAGVTDND